MRRRQIYEQRNKAVAPVVARDSYGVPVSSHTGDTAPAAVGPPPPQQVADLAKFYKFDGVTFVNVEPVKATYTGEPVQFEPVKRRRGRPPKVR